MTRIEEQLLSALEGLQSDYERQHREWQEASGALREIFERTSAENAALQERVERLSGQVTRLSEVLSR